MRNSGRTGCRGCGRAGTVAATILLLASGACAPDAAAPTAGEASVVATGVEHTLVGQRGSRGTLRADSTVLGDELARVHLVNPVLRIDTTTGRPLPLEIAADAGTLEVGTEIVRLVRPRRVSGAPATLLDADTIGYDPVGDSVWAVPGGRIR